MKTLTLLALALCLSAQPVAPVHGADVGCARATVALDEPPPLDCPMCGGNVQLHHKRTRFFLKVGATLVLWRFANSGVWR
jgi:hypothetical protein